MHKNLSFPLIILLTPLRSSSLFHQFFSFSSFPDFSICLNSKKKTVSLLFLLLLTSFSFPSFRPLLIFLHFSFSICKQIVASSIVHYSFLSNSIPMYLHYISIESFKSWLETKSFLTKTQNGTKLLKWHLTDVSKHTKSRKHQKVLKQSR